MGGKSSSSSSTSQATTTRDERIAATDNAVVIKDSLQNLTNLTTVDGGAFDFGEKAISSNESIILKVLDGAQSLVTGAYTAAGGALDKQVEFLNKANEKTTTDTTGAQKLAPWLTLAAVGVAVSMAIKK